MTCGLFALIKNFIGGASRRAAVIALRSRQRQPAAVCSMPVSERLQRALVVGFPPSAANHAQNVAAALEAMSVRELVNFLSARGSFMEGAMVDAQICGVAADIRKVRAADTPADTLCGGYALAFLRYSS